MACAAPAAHFDAADPSGDGLSPAQEDALGRLRESPYAAGLSDRWLLRFLAARKFRVDGHDGAGEMLRRNAAWREANFPLGTHPGSVPLATIEATLALRCFEVLPKRNAEGRSVLCLSLREFSRGPYQVVDHLVSLIYLVERTLAALQPGESDELVCLINVEGVKRPPTALLQRATPVFASYYPGLIRKVVVYPVGPVLAGIVDEMLPFVDVGGVRQQAAIQFCRTREQLAAELGAQPAGSAGGGERLCFEDLPQAVQAAHAAGSRPRELSRLAGFGGAVSIPEAAAACTRSHPYALQKLSRRSEQGEFVVHTPWYPEGVVQHHLSLEEEMVEFQRFMLLTPTEREQRAALRTSLQGLIAKCWPMATVKTVGALACGLSLATRPVQFAVEGCPSLDSLPAVLDQLEQSELQVTAPAADAVAAGDFVRVVTRAGVACDVSFHCGGKSRPRACVPVLKQLLGQFPAARPVLVVLAHVLGQSKYVGGDTGGLTAKSLLLMVLHVCHQLHAQHTGRTLNPEIVLRRVLTYYGREFDFASFAVDATSPSPAPRPACGDPVVVLDPADPGVNCAADCRRIMQIRMHLQYCDTALAKWSQQTAQPRNFRGRTPLSAIVSYEPLWSRRREINAGLSLQRSPASSNPASPPGTPTAAGSDSAAAGSDEVDR